MSTNVCVAEAYTDPGPKGDFCVVSVRAFNFLYKVLYAQY